MTVDRKCLINWVGGKRLLRKTIAPLIPKDIKSYIEPFGGGGWVLFYKDRWADLEIYNDLDGRLVNLFRIVKYHPNALKEELKYGKKGITLISLVVTIVVLLILAGVTIATLSGDNRNFN